MSPQIVRPMLLAKREICPIDRSSLLTGRFSGIFRDFPNYRHFGDSVHSLLPGFKSEGLQTRKEEL